MPRSRKRGRTATYITPSPSPRELSPQPITSVFQDSAAQPAMNLSSRPSSLAYLSSTLTHPPSLQEILSNSAPAPWTLAAFMAFLSQNHCLETLEFTMEADRYTSAYAELMSGQGTNIKEHNDQLCSLWQKLMDVYLVPAAPREVNLPAPVRDRLLHLPAQGNPPHPEELGEAVRIVYELMNDSVLGPFLDSFTVPHYEESAAEESLQGRQGRTKLRISRDSAPSTNEESSRSPKSSFLPLFGIHRSDQGVQSASSSSDSPETGASDDTYSPVSPRDEPMTPPTTPPTSDWGFNASPGTLQRAINAHNTGWKKMGQKLGLSRKAGRNKRSDATSITSGVPCAENSHSSSSNGSSYPL
ncbi:regulator of G protein signaling superfamily [Coniochaeta ligniaria NRRL 30616]|uniref:Regulator of G protein signaling superfamily n=1 Tax=Coniochaeta ligniaria NRRL 30616 TaxID=1408157 RepID=A0A1J7IK31_9PEZI|nr:regulator of G protein signaling superfamily [Coniochaeta ligniaria NRRL 30616]